VVDVYLKELRNVGHNASKAPLLLERIEPGEFRDSGVEQRERFFNKGRLLGNGVKEMKNIIS